MDAIVGGMGGTTRMDRTVNGTIETLPFGATVGTKETDRSARRVRKTG